MMREILFRAKDFHNRWRYGYYDGSADDPALIEENDDDMGAFWIQGETVGQFIGITDSNGVKIFEGDIVRCTWYDDTTSNGVVVFEDGRFLLESNGDCVDIDPSIKEVIGNIYDSPELLEEEGK